MTRVILPAGAPWPFPSVPPIAAPVRAETAKPRRPANRRTYAARPPLAEDAPW